MQIDNSLFELYSHFSDDLSRLIYLERARYSLSGSFSLSGKSGGIDFVELLRKSADGVFDEYDKFISQETKSPFWIWGASNCGDVILSQLGKLGLEHLVIGFIDNFKTGKFNGYPIASLDKVDKNAVILIANSQPDHARAIMVQITESGGGGGGGMIRFINHDILFKDEYFGLFTPGKNEVFVDAGCYDGGTSLEFIKWCHDSYKQIYAFEMEQANFAKCKDVLNKYDNITLSQTALLDYNGDVEINVAAQNRAGMHTVSRLNNSVSSAAVFEKQIIGKALTLDSFLSGSNAANVTLIKMDIEGSELRALCGAEKTIRGCKPRLAIAIYHKPEDIFELPLKILELNPDYKLYLRHYSPFDAETCLYAF